MRLINSNNDVLIENINTKVSPSSGYVKFTVKVDCDLNLISSENGSATIDVPDVREDRGLLFLPSSYTPTGKPTRLVIYCHGMWNALTDSTTTRNAPVSDLVKLGYAVLDMNGIPADYYKEVTGDTSSENEGNHFGCELALQSYFKAYQYAINNYNLYKEVFVCGLSMGGLTALMITQQNNIPVLANGLYSPVTDHFKQMFPLGTTICGKLFGFDDVSNYANANEWYLANINKTMGFNPMLHNTNWQDIDLYGANPDYTKLVKYDEVPLKIWHCVDDNIVSPIYSQYLVDAIRRGGGRAYYREYATGGHGSWNNGDDVTVKGVDGSNITVKSSCYELYNWFKRFEV